MRVRKASSLQQEFSRYLIIYRITSQRLLQLKVDVLAKINDNISLLLVTIRNLVPAISLLKTGQGFVLKF